MIYLVEVQAHNGVEVVTLYFGTDGYTTKPTDTPANIYYDPRISDPGNFERFLFGEGTTRGATRTGAGDIVLNSGDPGNGVTLDYMLGYAFDGRPIVIKSIPDLTSPISSATVLFRGTCKQLAYSDPVNQVSILINDRLADLEKPLLTARYAGTTITTGPTAEGDVNLKDQIKPCVWGVKSNVPGVQTNAFDLIYQFSNGPVQSLLVCDGAFPLTGTVDFPTIAALQAWVQVPGKYATCLALASARLGAQPGKAVTADVVEGATAADRTAAQIVRRMLLGFGFTALDVPLASFTALDALNPAQCGILVDDESNALDIVQRVLDSIGGWISPDSLGVFRVGRLELPTGPAADTYTEYEFLEELDLQPVLDDGAGLPPWRTTIRWGQVGLVQGQNDTYPSVDTARRSLVASEWREIKVESPAVKIIHPSAVEISVDSCLAYEPDATAEANRRHVLYSQTLVRYRVVLHVSVAGAAQIGSDIALLDDRLGLNAGKLFKVIGRTDEYEESTVTIDVFGAA